VPVVALFLVVVAGLIHASWNLVAKKASGGVPFSALSTLAALIIWLPVGVPVLASETPSYGSTQWLLLSASGFLHVLYFAALLRGYEVGDLSVVYPVARGTGPLITVAASVLVLGESPGTWGFIGVVLIVVGVVLIAGGARWIRSRNSATTSTTKRIGPGLKYGLLTGLLIAAYTVLDGYSVRKQGITPIALDYGSLLFRVPITLLFAWVVTRRQRSFDVRTYFKANWKYAAFVGFISPVAYVLVLQATKLSQVSQVAPAREVSMLFAALFAGSLLQEDGLVERLTGAAFITAGVIAIALG
jgi:drug/metabolite transporter (DMT)-like permease